MRLENHGAAPFEDVARNEVLEPALSADTSSPAAAPGEAPLQEPSQTLSDMGQQLPHWVKLAPAASAAASPEAPSPPPPQPQEADAGADRSADVAFIAQHQATLASMLQQAQVRLDQVDTFHHGISEGYLDYASEIEFDAASTEVQRLEAEMAEGAQAQDAGPQGPEPEVMAFDTPEPRPADGPPEPADEALPLANGAASDRSLLNASEQLANPAAYASVKNRTAESGDSWARIARQEYGDERFAQALAQANGAASSILRRGQQVFLPDLSGADLRAGGAFVAADAAARAAPRHSVIDSAGIDLSGASFEQLSVQAPAARAPRPGPQAAIKQELDEGAIDAALGDANPMAYRLESDSTRGKFITGMADGLWKGITELPLQVTDVVTAGWNVATGDNQHVGYSMLGEKLMSGPGGLEGTAVGLWETAKNTFSVIPLVGGTRAAYHLGEALQNGDPQAAGASVAGLGASLVAAKGLDYRTTAVVSDGLKGPLSQRGAVATFRLEPLYENQLPSGLADELAVARSKGVSPISPVGPGFDAAIAEGTIKYAITASGDLLVIPKLAADGTEISHAVITGGKPVIAAGEAEIAGNARDGYIGLDINEHSGHFMNGNTAAQNAAVMVRAKNAFAKYGIEF